jgi:hypothetical protein
MGFRGGLRELSATPRPTQSVSVLRRGFGVDADVTVESGEHAQATLAPPVFKLPDGTTFNRAPKDMHSWEIYATYRLTRLLAYFLPSACPDGSGERLPHACLAGRRRPDRNGQVGDPSLARGGQEPGRRAASSHHAVRPAAAGGAPHASTAYWSGVVASCSPSSVWRRSNSVSASRITTSLAWPVRSAQVVVSPRAGVGCFPSARGALP